MNVALDDRIKVAVPVVGTCDFGEQSAARLASDWDPKDQCHYVPGLYRYANNHELLAMAAPKPVLIVSATADKSFPVNGVRNVAEYGRRLYRSYGLSDRFGYFEDSAEGHGYQVKKREAATPYILDTQKQKLELAKTSRPWQTLPGGVIVIGYDCERQPTTAGERICEVKEFSLNLVDADRWSQILVNLVHPAPHGVTVRVFTGHDGKGVAAIIIDAAAMTEKPYIVSKMIDEDGANIGSYFG